MQRPTLYGLSGSVYTRTARLALEEKGVDYALVEVEIFGPDGVPADHYARHPFGRIPVLEHGDFLLYETAAITRYVDETFSGPPLQPSEPRSRARMTQVIGILDAYIYRPMIWDVFVQRVSISRDGGVADESLVASAMPRIRTGLRALSDLLGTQCFFAGNSLSLADLHAAPMLTYFSFTPEGKSELRDYSTLGRWLQDLRARPSMQRTRFVLEI